MNGADLFAMWVIGFMSGLGAAYIVCRFARRVPNDGLVRTFENNGQHYAVVAIEAPDAA